MKDSIGQGFHVTGIDTNISIGELSIEKISASIFPLKNGTVDTWIQILISNKSKKECIINSICIATDKKVRIESKANILMEGNENYTQNPSWSRMYKGFKNYSPTFGSFDFQIKDKQFVNNYSVVPYNFDIEQHTLFSNSANVEQHNFYYKLLRFKKINDNNASSIRLPPTNKEKYSSVLLFLKITDNRIVKKIDEASYYFDYYIDSEAYKSKRIYMHFVLPKGAIFLSSNSMPKMNIFRPRRERNMFYEWITKYKIKSTNQTRILRSENLEEKHRDYLYCSSIYTFPRQRFIQQLLLFSIALISGAILSSLISSIFFDVMNLTDKKLFGSILILVFIFIILIIISLIMKKHKN